MTLYHNTGFTHHSLIWWRTATFTMLRKITVVKTTGLRVPSFSLSLSLSPLSLTHIHTHTCTSTCTCARTCAHMHTHMHAHMHVCMCVHAHTHVRMPTCTCACACMHTHMCACPHSHAYIHTHTNTHICQKILFQNSTFDTAAAITNHHLHHHCSINVCSVYFLSCKCNLHFLSFTRCSSNYPHNC